MASFKEGNLVRCIKRPVDNSRYQSLVGKTGTVESASGSDVIVQWDDWNDGWGQDGNKWTVATDEVALVQNKPFKEGDKVRIKDGFCGQHSGKVVTVVQDDGSITLPLEVQHGESRWETTWVEYSWVEKISEDDGLYVVIVEQEGKLAPATTPRTYKTAALANHVADDMAKRHGGKFLVFRATYESVNTVTSRSL